MDADLVLLIGMVLMILSVPSLLAAWAESTTPRWSVAVLVIGMGLVATAVVVKPSGYSIVEIPGLMLDVVMRYIPW
jgi:hypothetical protein